LILLRLTTWFRQHRFDTWLLSAGPGAVAAVGVALASSLIVGEVGWAEAVASVAAGVAAAVAAAWMLRRDRKNTTTQVCLALARISDGADSASWSVALPSSQAALLGSLRNIAAALARARDERERDLKERTRELEQALAKTRELEGARRALLARTTSILEEERRRISQDIHDALGANLMVVALLAEQLRQMCETMPVDLDSRDSLLHLANLLHESSASAYASSRSMSKAMHPETLDTLGLSSALRDLVAEFGEAKRDCRFHFDCSEVTPLRGPVALALYRVAQEALTNIVKHSGATDASVNLTQGAGRITLTVSDNGIGFDPSRHHLGLGVMSMRERMEAVGGDLAIATTPSLTVLTARAPATEAAGVC
jgi:signal transduction histidine kinase